MSQSTFSFVGMLLCLTGAVCMLVAILNLPRSGITEWWLLVLFGALSFMGGMMVLTLPT